MTSITVHLREALKAKLKSHARMAGRSSSALVRDLIENSLSASKLGQHPRPRLLDQLGDLVGKGQSRVPELATDSKHLASFGKSSD
jgi:hypothetical protein